MCTAAEPAAPSSTARALAMVRAGLGYLSAVDAAGLDTAVQAEALLGLERAEAQHTAARAKILNVFAGQHGYEADGYYGAASWLRARTNVTRAAAGAATAWARRLRAHPVIAAALAGGRSLRRWPGRSAIGPTASPRSIATTRTGFCWRPPPAGRIRMIWRGWRGR